MGAITPGSRSKNLTKGNALVRPEEIGRFARHGRPGGPQKERPRPSGSNNDYLSSTLAPASSSFFLSSAASVLLAPSLTGFGAAFPRSFGFFYPRPVIARTSLITLIFFSPASSSTTVNSVCSAAGAAAAAPPAAATATGAAAE